MRTHIECECDVPSIQLPFITQYTWCYHAVIVGSIIVIVIVLLSAVFFFHSRAKTEFWWQPDEMKCDRVKCRKETSIISYPNAHGWHINLLLCSLAVCLPYFIRASELFKVIHIIRLSSISQSIRMELLVRIGSGGEKDCIFILPCALFKMIYLHKRDRNELCYSADDFFRFFPVSF